MFMFSIQNAATMIGTANKMVETCVSVLSALVYSSGGVCLPFPFHSSMEDSMRVNPQSLQTHSSVCWSFHCKTIVRF